MSSSSSSMLLARTSQRLKQLMTSNSSSKKSANHDSLSPSSNPNCSPVTPPATRRTSRPHSWISHTSTRKCELSNSPTTATTPTPRIEPPAIPNAAKARTKSDGGVGLHPGNGSHHGHATLFSKSESSLCCTSACLAHACAARHHEYAHGCEESDCSLSAHDAPCTPTSCRIRVPRKSSRRNKAAHSPSSDLFLSTPNGATSSDRNSGASRRAQLSTLDLLEALELDPEQSELSTPTQSARSSHIEETRDDYSLPLSRTAWSDDVEQLIRETDKAFKAVSFALSDAKEATSTNEFRPINWRPDLNPNESGAEDRKASVRMRGKQAAKTPLTRNASIKAAKPKRKKSKSGIGRKTALQAFPDTRQNPTPRWTLPEVTADLFGGRMFGRVEADEMLNSEESIQHARWSRESLKTRTDDRAEERKRESLGSQDTLNSAETREEDRSTPVEPFHLEDLSSRLGQVKVVEGHTAFETPRPSPMPPVPVRDTARAAAGYFDSKLSSRRVINTVLPPIPPYSPISPPTPGAVAIFNATAPLSPVSAISPPLQTLHDNGTTDQDPFRFGRLRFPAPPIVSQPSQPQPIPHRASRSRSVTRTSLATIREASPVDINTRTVSQSVPATPAKNRSPIRSPSSSGTISPMISGQVTPSQVLNSNGRGGTTLLHSALHRGFTQRSNSQTAIASAELIAGSLSPRKITPFPASIADSRPSSNAGLVSTPFSLTAPLFRHGSIRLNNTNQSRSFPGSGTTTGIATPLFNMDGGDGLEALVKPLDWTAFQMAISGGAGDYLMLGDDIGKDSKEEAEKEMEAEVQDIANWWRGFGFRGRDGGMGRVSRSEPKKSAKGKDGKRHSKGGEEKKKRRNRKPEMVIAELPGESREEKPRPFSFMPGLEDLRISNSGDKHISLCSDGDEQDARRRASGMAAAEDGYDTEGTLPESPMEEINEQALREGRDVLMGFNLGHDLPDFLRWESFNAGNLMHHGPKQHVDRMHSV